MTRITIIGNSHVAALKVAWDAMAADHPGIEVDFFAAPGRYFRRFRLLDGLTFGLPVAARIDGAVLDASGRAEVDLSQADHVIWAGYFWPWDAVVGLMLDFDIDGLREIGASQVLSRAAFDAFCGDIVKKVTPPPEWLNWPWPRLILLPAPMRSADCLASRSARFRVCRLLASRPAGARETIGAFMDVFAGSMRAQGIELVAQPKETLLPNGLSAPRFSRGARRILDPTASTEDVTHMNAEYGKLQLREVLSRLALPERPPTQAGPLDSTAPFPVAGRLDPAARDRQRDEAHQRHALPAGVVAAIGDVSPVRGSARESRVAPGTRGETNSGDVVGEDTPPEAFA
jgi:hypothetical protein